MAKIFAPCPLMPNRKTEIEFEENRKEWLYYFYQAKGIHTRLVPQELCPVLLGIGRGFYTLMKVLLFFFPLVKFQNSYSCHQATQQPGLLSLKLSASDLFEMHNDTTECRGRRMPGAEYNSYEVRE